MQGDIFPRHVPLPKVEEYESSILFNKLALPEDYDYGSLLINVRAINRFCTMAGIEDVSVNALEPTPAEKAAGPPFSRRLFTMMAGTSKSKVREPLARTSITFPSGNSYVGNAKAVISINAAERSRRIENAGLDPSNSLAHAALLQKSLRIGLMKAAYQANIQDSGVFIDTTIYNVLSHGVPLPALMIGGLASSTLLGAYGAWRSNKKADKRNVASEDETKRYSILDARFSLLPHMSFDRLALSTGVLATNRLVIAGQ